MAFFDNKAIEKAEIIARYIDRVESEAAGALTTVPHPYFPTSLIGDALPSPSESSLNREVDASDLVDLLTTHAYNLSRYRKATWEILGNVAPAGNYGTNVLYRLNDSYRSQLPAFNAAAPDNNIEADKEVTSAGMDAYIEQLRSVYLTAREDGVLIQVCHGSCHGSCHDNCHGSRGRR